MSVVAGLNENIIGDVVTALAEDRKQDAWEAASRANDRALEGIVTKERVDEVAGSSQSVAWDGTEWVVEWVYLHSGDIGKWVVFMAHNGAVVDVVGCEQDFASVNDALDVYRECASKAVSRPDAALSAAGTLCEGAGLPDVLVSLEKHGAFDSHTSVLLIPHLYLRYVPLTAVPTAFGRLMDRVAKGTSIRIAHSLRLARLASDNRAAFAGVRNSIALSIDPMLDTDVNLDVQWDEVGAKLNTTIVRPTSVSWSGLTTMLETFKGGVLAVLACGDSIGGGWRQYRVNLSPGQFVSVEDVLAGRISIPTGCVVVLMACDMSHEKPDVSHEALGMSAALLARGAGVVVVPLWEVDDAVGAQIVRLTTLHALYELNELRESALYDVAGAFSRGLLAALEHREAGRSNDSFASLSFVVYG